MKTGHPIFLPPPPPQHAPDSSFHRTLCLFCVLFLLSLSLSPSFLFLSMILRQLALAFTYHEGGGESFARAQRTREGMGEIKQIRGKESKGTLSLLGNENCSQAGRERKKRRIAPLLSRVPSPGSRVLSSFFSLLPFPPFTLVTRASEEKTATKLAPTLSSGPLFLPLLSPPSFFLFSSLVPFPAREERRKTDGKWCRVVRATCTRARV